MCAQSSFVVRLHSFGTVFSPRSFPHSPPSTGAISASGLYRFAEFHDVCPDPNTHSSVFALPRFFVRFLTDALLVGCVLSLRSAHEVPRGSSHAREFARRTRDVPPSGRAVAEVRCCIPREFLTQAVAISVRADLSRFLTQPVSVSSSHRTTQGRMRACARCCEARISRCPGIPGVSHGPEVMSRDLCKLAKGACTLTSFVHACTF